MMNPAQTEVASTKKVTGQRKRGLRKNFLGWILVAPATLVLLIFFLIPVGFLVWISFHDWPLIGGTTEFVFLDNYPAIEQNELFRNSVIFTIKYMLIILVVLMLLGLVLALLVQESKSRFTGIFRTGFFMPVVTGLSTAALLFLGLLNPVIGPIPDLLQRVGITWDFLATSNHALFSTVIMMTWRFTGFYMVILLTGLQAIPRELYESAQVDGATRTQILRKITIPLLRPSIAMCVVLITTGGLVAFEQFYIITAGGPDNSTITMVMTIFREAFGQFNLGSAAAMSMVLLFALVAINLLQLRLLKEDTK
jgi:multiple sugar transport system permease protein